jgi:3-oxoacyl-[acyl-carrier protein] reductase
VITGGAQGLGLSIAKRFVRSRATVSLWDKDPAAIESALAELGGRTAASGDIVDVSDVNQIKAAADSVIAAYGKVDILVASAGIAGPNHTVWEYPVDAWTQVLDINLSGVFYCCRALLPHMLQRNYGRIVNISSIAGKEGNPMASAYAASKAGVIALTKALGKETATKNIAVNCITPAAAKTRILDQLTPEFIEYMLAKIPRGRFLEVDEVAAMVAWLVSEENSFTTGAVFDLSGGRATY